jgi:predicted nucleic acid-binding protein
MKGIMQGHDGLVGIRQALLEGWLKELALKGRVERRLFESLSLSLGLGEASSMAIAKSRRYVFACDDKAARRESDLLGTKLTGTIGILARAVHCRIIAIRKADGLLREMVAHGFYSPVQSIREVL